MNKIEKITPQIAALYLGAKCEYPDHEGNKTIATLTGVASDGLETTYKRKKNGVCGDIIGWEQKSEYQKCFAGVVKLHLRRLETITEQEAREVYKAAQGVTSSWPSALTWWNNPTGNDYRNSEIEIGTPAVWLYLLGKGFDLFGLIDAGLAIETK